jgi:hypothetical protein
MFQQPQLFPSRTVCSDLVCQNAQHNMGLRATQSGISLLSMGRFMVLWPWFEFGQLVHCVHVVLLCLQGYWRSSAHVCVRSLLGDGETLTFAVPCTHASSGVASVFRSMCAARSLPHDWLDILVRLGPEALLRSGFYCFCPAGVLNLTCRWGKTCPLTVCASDSFFSAGVKDQLASTVELAPMFYCGTCFSVLACPHALFFLSCQVRALLRQQD